MFGANYFGVPGIEEREFVVLRPVTRMTDNNRPLSNSFEAVGKIEAILAQANSKERERWNQLGHPITHKIIQQFTSELDIRSGDIFERAGRRFYNAGMPYNPGDLGNWTIYYCEEGSDVT